MITGGASAAVRVDAVLGGMLAGLTGIPGSGFGAWVGGRERRWDRVLAEADSREWDEGPGPEDPEEWYRRQFARMSRPRGER